ncbi:MAG: ectonucleotide pyrophosphatase/phosphodiesterase, partial [Fuerstiella sp.]
MSRLTYILALSLFVAAPSARAVDRQVRHIVLVSVDGLSASYLTDQRANMPNLRSMAQQGASAEGMITSFPSVTWPSHTSLITGTVPARHGVIGNAVWNRKTHQEVKYIGDPVLTKDEAIRVPTLYDVAHNAGLSTASVIWPCSNGAKTLNWIIPDSNKTEIHARYTTPGFADELADAGIDISKLGEWGWGKQHSTNRDIVYTQVTKHLLSQHKVELILLHLITPDGVEHGYGPNT